MKRIWYKSFQVALCSAYARIAEVCPPHIWKPEYLISALYHSEPCLPLIECFEVALSTLGVHLVRGILGNNEDLTVLALEEKSIESGRLGQKRSIRDMDSLSIKRQKLNEETVVADASLDVERKSGYIVACQTVEGYASHMNKSLLSFVDSLNAPAVRPGSLRPEIALSALSILCITFSIYPKIDLSLRIFRQMLAWLPWIANQVGRYCYKFLLSISISIYIFVFFLINLLAGVIGKTRKLNYCRYFHILGRNSQCIAFSK